MTPAARHAHVFATLGHHLDIAGPASFAGATAASLAAGLIEFDDDMPSDITGAAEIEPDVAAWLALHPSLPAAHVEDRTLDLAFARLMEARAIAVVDAHPRAFLIADENMTPMRRVAFDDLHADLRVECPLVFTDIADARARADAWNDRLQDPHKALSVTVLETSDWLGCFLDTIDMGLLIEDALKEPA